MARKRSRKKKASKTPPPEPVFSEVEDAFFSSVTTLEPPGSASSLPS